MARRVVNRTFEPVIESPTNDALTELSNIRKRVEQQAKINNQSLVDRGLTAMGREITKNKLRTIDESISNASQPSVAGGVAPVGIENIALAKQQEAMGKAIPQVRGAMAKQEEEKLSAITNRLRTEEAEKKALERLVAIKSGGGVFTGSLTDADRQALISNKANIIAQAEEDALRARALNLQAGGQPQDILPAGGLRRGKKTSSEGFVDDKDVDPVTGRTKREQAIVNALAEKNIRETEARTKQAIKESETVTPEQKERAKKLEETQKQAKKQEEPEQQATLSETRALQKKIKAGEKLADYEQDLINRRISIKEYNNKKRAAQKEKEKEKNITEASVRSSFAKNGIEGMTEDELKYAREFMLDEINIPEEKKPEDVMLIYRFPDGSERQVLSSREQEFLDLAKSKGIKPTKITREKRPTVSTRNI